VKADIASDEQQESKKHVTRKGNNIALNKGGRGQEFRPR
jgi:hypothetical protein